MNIKEIRLLVKLMVDNRLTELDVADGENKVHLKRGPEGEEAPAPAEPAPAAALAAPAQAVDENIIEIKSPMVGTFYTAPSPDSEPCVEIGSRADPDTVVCIVEAMKVMNEIKAECSGTIIEVCASNAQPVEFGQVLFRVRSA
jgi:acetyl-CoA carboxylase biotin carboxyl carrier protein